jgi:hypothetical protein
MNCCVVIPVHTDQLSSNHISSVKRTIEIFKQYEVTILCHPLISSWVRSTFGDAVKLTVLSESFFKSVRDYNRLMLSGEFYGLFSSSDFILICQPDVFVYRDCLSSFIGRADYGGAITLFHEPQAIVGNGGFSLRRVTAIQSLLAGDLKIPKLWKWSLPLWKRFFLNCFVFVGLEDFFVRTGRINEDYIYSTMIKDDKRMSPVDARYFSRDAIKPVENIVPMGFHGWEKYSTQIEREFILRKLNV